METTVVTGFATNSNQERRSNMMLNANIRMSTKVKKNKLLETLRKNLEKHTGIVKEARIGFVKQAQKTLERELEKVKKTDPKRPMSISVYLVPPQDYSEVYVNTISMLEWNTEEEIELQADEFRQLVRDEWEWKSSFLNTNATYSKQAFDWVNENAGGSLVPPPDLEDSSYESPRR